MDPYSSPYIIPNHSPHNPFPHSLLRIRQKLGIARKGFRLWGPTANLKGLVWLFQLMLDILLELIIHKDKEFPRTITISIAVLGSDLRLGFIIRSFWAC